MFLKRMYRKKKLILIILIFIILVTSVFAVWDIIARGVVGCGAGMWVTASGDCNEFTPSDVGNCDICNNNPLQRCTEYRCMTLGKNCRFNLDPNEGDVGKCIGVSEDDIHGPLIESCNILLMRENEVEFLENEDPDFCEIKDISSSGAIIEITTDELAMCGIGNEKNMDYDKMSELDSNYVLRHYVPMLPPMDTFEEQKIVCDAEGSCKIYVKCRDYNNNVKRGDAFIISYTLGKSVGDSSPPYMLLDEGVITNGVSLPLGQSSVKFNVEVFDITGVVGCKYSRNEDKPYEDMEGSFNCEDGTLVLCNAELTGLEDEMVNTFYFRCKDDVTPIANVDQKGVEFVLNGGTALDITVTNVIDGGDVLRGDYLSVSTSGGNYNGDAICSYRDNSNNLIFEESEASTTHGLEFSLFDDNGLHTIKISCEDYDGNSASDEISVNVESVPLDVVHYSESPGVVVQDVSIDVVTSGGDNDGEANCKLFKKTYASYKDNNGIPSSFVEGNKHIFNLKEKNGEYNWYVACQDLTERNEEGVEVSFEIDTPNLDMGINPKTGTTLDKLNVDVIITTAKGVDNDGMSVCKYVPEPEFSDDDRWLEDGWDIEDEKRDKRHILYLPGEGKEFAQSSNIYYIVCRDDAGKTNGQIVTYNIDLSVYDLKIDEFKINEKSDSITTKISPSFSFVTKNGRNQDGSADCSISCDHNGDTIYGSVSKSSVADGYKHSGSFRNLNDGDYRCKISCDDGYIGKEIDKSFTISTPDLGIVDIMPRGEVEKENLRLMVVTSGGIDDNGNSNCYYTDYLVDDFNVNGIIDITKKSGVSAIYWADGIFESYDVAGGRYKHVEDISRKVGVGENVLYVQCKDRVGKLAPKDGPQKIEFNVS